MAQRRVIADLITEDWRVHASIYTDPAIFSLEQERLFRGPWLYVAHESEVREPGDYKTTFAGTQPVVVARGADDGVVRVLLNRCRHRGATVCNAEFGNANYFRCPYHGWTYRNTGELIGFPFKAGYGGKGGLIAVAPNGDAAWGFTTPAMYRGMADASGRTVAIYADEDER